MTLQNLAENWDGSYEQKEKFHREGRKLLKEVASRLGLKKENFSIRSNKGGPAVLGDVILHSDTLYINLGGSYFNKSFMFRSCKGQKDYTGGTNNWMTYEFLCNNLSDAVEIFRHPSEFYRRPF
jgi:hypothetical protein